MKTSYLFPHRFKVVSGVVFIVALTAMFLLYASGEDEYQITAKVFAIIADVSLTNDNILFGDTVFFSWIENTVTDEICMLFVLVSGILFAFAKEKHEDEMVAAIRLHSLAWATIINYVILLLGYLFVYGFVFFNVMMVALVSQLLIFIILFRYKMYRFYNTLQHEE